MFANANVATLCSGFFHWWLGELRSCLPDKVRTLFGANAYRLIAEVGAEKTRFVVSSGDRSETIEAIEITPKQRDQAPAMVRALIRGSRIRDPRVTVRIAPGRFLQRTIELPAATQKNLRDAIAFEMDRNTPFTVDEVLFDYRVLGKDPKRERVKIELAILPKSVATDALEMVTSCHLIPSALCLEVASASGRWTVNLLPKEWMRRIRPISDTVTLWLCAALIILVCLAIYLPITQKKEILSALEAEISEARKQAVVVDQLDRRIQEVRGRSISLNEARSGSLTALEVLDELSRLLPDNTWLVGLSWRDAKLVISGYSTKATELISLFQRSPLFASARFTAPVTHEQASGLEHFSISVTAANRE